MEEDPLQDKEQSEDSTVKNLNKDEEKKESIECREEGFTLEMQFEMYGSHIMTSYENRSFRQGSCILKRFQY